MANRMLTALALLLLFLCASAVAQADPGIRDTLRIDSVQTDAGIQAVVDVSFYNNETLCGRVSSV